MGAMNNPRFLHNCDVCVFLGHLEGNDLYFCPKEPTVLARYGDDGPEYTSGISLAELDPRLAEAFRRADKKGLLDGPCHPLMAERIRKLRGLRLPSLFRGTGGK